MLGQFVEFHVGRGRGREGRRGPRCHCRGVLRRHGRGVGHAEATCQGAGKRTDFDGFDEAIRGAAEGEQIPLSAEARRGTHRHGRARQAMDGMDPSDVGLARVNTRREERGMRGVCVRAGDGGMANKHSHARVGANWA